MLASQRLLSSSPDRAPRNHNVFNVADNFAGPQLVLSSNPTKAEDHGNGYDTEDAQSDGLTGKVGQAQDGELSPTFDASFASSMSFHSSGSDQADAMDCSPALRPAAATVVNATSKTLGSRPAFSRNLKSLPASSHDGKAAFNTSFFSNMSANKPKRPLQPSKLSLERNSGERIFGKEVNINAARPIKPAHERSKSEAVLNFGRSANNVARPPLLRAELTLGNSNTAEVISKAKHSASLLARRPSMPDEWKPVGLPVRASTAPELETKTSLRRPLPPANLTQTHTHSNKNEDKRHIAVLQAHPEETSSPPIDHMDIDILSPPKPKHNWGTISGGGNGSFSELFDASPQQAAAAAQIQQLPSITHSFSQTASANPKKRSFEADDIEELSESISSESAVPSSPLAKALAARPPLQKANTTAAAGASFLSHSQRRRLSERSNSAVTKPSAASIFGSNTLNPKSSSSNIFGNIEASQVAKKAKAEHGSGSHSFQARPSFQSRRSQSVCDPSFLMQAKQMQSARNDASIGLGMPPRGIGKAKDYFDFRPTHGTSNSESLINSNGMSFAKPRPASDTLARPHAHPHSAAIAAVHDPSGGATLSSSAYKDNGPNLWGSEADGKALPCHAVKSDGLMRITPKVVADLVAGKYNALIDRYIIIDCRFPWEYDGGHIKGAINLSTTAQLEHFFFTPNEGLWESRGSLPVPSHSAEETASGKTVIIFHCEFSCMRAPQHAGHIRSQDRSRCKDFYPRHLYPETYIVAGGFAAFYESYATLCEPQGYVQMKESANCPRALDEFKRRSALGRAKSFTFGAEPESQPFAPAVNANRLSNPAAAMLDAAIKEENSIDTSQSLSNESEDVNDSPCPPSSQQVLLKTRLQKGQSLPTRTLQRAATETSGNFGHRMVTR